MGLMEKKWVKGIIAVVVIATLIFMAILATLKKPEVQVSSVRLHRIGEGYVDLKLRLDVINDNVIGGRLKKIEADTYVEGDYLGPAFTEEEFDVPAMKTSRIEVILRVNHVVQPSDRIRAKGIAYIEIFGLTFRVPFDTGE